MVERKPARRRRDRGEIATLLERFDASGLSQQRFAALIGVHANTVGYWLRSRRRGPRAKKRAAALVPLRVLSERERAGAESIFSHPDDLLEIRLRTQSGEATIRAPRGFSGRDLRVLLEVLRAGAC